MSKLIIVCGAGISASSGIPTYRSEDPGSGLWNINDMKRICTVGNEFTDDSIAFYDNFRSLLSTVEPSQVHLQLAEIQKSYGPARVKIFTQNIDDLLERAGCSEVTHVHGTVWNALCLECGGTTEIGYTPLSTRDRACRCGGRLKNDVVFYGDRGRYSNMLESILDMDARDVFVLMGTSATTLHVDMILRLMDSTHIYYNPVVEEAVDISNYQHVLLRKCEDGIEEFNNLVKEYM